MSEHAAQKAQEELEEFLLVETAELTPSARMNASSVIGVDETIDYNRHSIAQPCW